MIFARWVSLLFRAILARRDGFCGGYSFRPSAGSFSYAMTRYPSCALSRFPRQVSFGAIAVRGTGDFGIEKCDVSDQVSTTVNNGPGLPVFVIQDPVDDFVEIRCVIDGLGFIRGVVRSKGHVCPPSPTRILS
jgi:hypothetical protein